MEDLDQIVAGLILRAISNGPCNLEAFRGTHLHWPCASLALILPFSSRISPNAIPRSGIEVKFDSSMGRSPWPPLANRINVHTHNVVARQPKANIAVRPALTRLQRAKAAVP